MTLTMTDVVSVCVFPFSCQQTKDDPCCDNDAAGDDYEILFRVLLFFFSDLMPINQTQKARNSKHPKIKEARQARNPNIKEVRQARCPTIIESQHCQKASIVGKIKKSDSQIASIPGKIE